MRESRNNIALRVCKIAVITHTEPLKIRIAHCKNAGLYYCARIKNRHFTVAVRVAAFPWGGADYIYYTTEYRDLFLQGPEATPIGVVLGPSYILLIFCFYQHGVITRSCKYTLNKSPSSHRPPVYNDQRWYQHLEHSHLSLAVTALDCLVMHVMMI